VFFKDFQNLASVPHLRYGVNVAHPANAFGFSIGNKGYVGTGAGASGNTKDFWEYCP